MLRKDVLCFQNIKKSFGDNVVLDGVNFEVMQGEVVALLGENGAGKSTLMNILFGMSAIQQTGGFEGSVYIDGQETHILSPNDAISKGIGMVHQEFMLIPSFSVVQNIKLNREPLCKNAISRIFGEKFDTINTRKMHDDAKNALERVGIEVNPDDRIEMLPVGIKQFVEISREIDKTNIKLLVFDEPTSVLTENEAEKLLECIRKFAEEGISIIFISHRLDEIMQVSDRVVILRDGQLVENQCTENLTKERIAELMVGRPLAEKIIYDSERIINSDDIIMEFKDVSVGMPGEEIRNVNLEIRRGEILGVGGLAGHGKMSISNAVAGIYSTVGEIIYNGKVINVNKTGEALRHEIAFVSEDRKGVGLLLDQSIHNNIIFTNVCIKRQFLKRFGLFTQVDMRGSKRVVDEMIKKLEIRCVSAEQIVGSLSGGNQQKVCLARALISEPKILFISEPTRGIDIGAKKLLLNYLIKINHEQGITIVMLSSELNELRSICDRIVIVANSEVQGILPPDADNIEFALMMSGDSSIRNHRRTEQ